MNIVNEKMETFTSSMGTTIVALKYNGGVLMACDSTTSAGIFVTQRSAVKANNISPSTVNYGPIYVLRCGKAASSQVIMRNVYNYLNFHAMELGHTGKIDLQTVGTLFKNMCYPNKEFIESRFIFSNGKEIMSIDRSGALFRGSKIAMHGSGATHINGFLKYHYKEDAPKEKTRDILIKALALAIQVDNSSGGNIQVIDISESGEIKQDLIDHNDIPKVIDSQMV